MRKWRLTLPDGNGEANPVPWPSRRLTERTARVQRTPENKQMLSANKQDIRIHQLKSDGVQGRKPPG